MQFFGSKKSVLEKKFSIFLRKMIGCVVHTLILSWTTHKEGRELDLTVADGILGEIRRWISAANSASIESEGSWSNARWIIRPGKD